MYPDPKTPNLVNMLDRYALRIAPVVLQAHLADRGLDNLDPRAVALLTLELANAFLEERTNYEVNHNGGDSPPDRPPDSPF